jgi:hypothetical protein
VAHHLGTDAQCGGGFVSLYDWCRTGKPYAQSREKSVNRFGVRGPEDHGAWTGSERIAPILHTPNVQFALCSVFNGIEPSRAT